MTEYFRRFLRWRRVWLALMLAASLGPRPPAPALAAGLSPAPTTCASPLRPADTDSPTARALKARIETIVGAAPSGRWGVYVHDVDTDETVSVGGDDVLHPASTIKVAIAADTFAWLEQHPTVTLANGPAGAGRSYAQLLRAMLVESEEAATASLTDFLNAQPGFGLNRHLRNWGARCSSVLPRRATAADLALLLERLYRGELVSASSTDVILALLREPSPDDIARLGRGLPWAVRGALVHKTGTLFQDGLGVVADMGLVATLRGHYVIAVIGNEVDWTNYYDALRLIGAISQAAYETWGPGEGAVACPPDTLYEYAGLGGPPC